MTNIIGGYDALKYKFRINVTLFGVHIKYIVPNVVAW